MNLLNQKLLKRLASKYIWWKTPDEAVVIPQYVIAQVINMGDYDDVQKLASQVDDDVLRGALLHAETGQFNESSSAYWHCRLGLASVDQVPALPTRKFK